MTSVTPINIIDYVQERTDHTLLHHPFCRAVGFPFGRQIRHRQAEVPAQADDRSRADKDRPPYQGVEIALEVGQAAASDVELAEYMDCNRKTIGKLIDSFNKLGMLTTRTNNRTSVHTLHFLTGWYVDGVLLTNPHYVKPAAVSKRQADGAWTPYSNDMPSEDKPCAVPDGCQCPRQDADSMAGGAAALSSSLCSPVVSDSSESRTDAEDKADSSNAGEQQRAAWQ